MCEILLLVAAGFMAGAINAIAGGGMLLVFPLLLAGGLSPITANVTSKLILSPGAMAAAWGYRAELKRVPRRYLLLLLPCYMGAVVGLFGLQHTSNDDFKYVLPWLLLAAVSFFVLQPKLNRYVQRPLRHRVSWYVIAALLFVGAIYGGYFGAGFGFLFMALLGFTGLRRIYQFSALKNLAGGGIEIIGVIYFTIVGGIAWVPGSIAMLGCIAGGYIGARYALGLAEHIVRGIVVVIGVALVAVTFAQTYGHLVSS